MNVSKYIQSKSNQSPAFFADHEIAALRCTKLAMTVQLNFNASLQTSLRAKAKQPPAFKAEHEIATLRYTMLAMTL